MSFEIENHVLIKYIEEPNVTEIIIPEGITHIGQYAFSQGCLRKVVLPESIIKIEDGAFFQCGSLEAINFPSNLEHIGICAFYACGLKRVILPEGVKKINIGTFNLCNYLEEVHLPDSVTQIDNFAFAECINLEKIHLPDHLTEISTHAFRNCEHLNMISIPESVNVIGKGAFQGTPWLKQLQNQNDLVIVNHILIWAKIISKVFTIPKGITCLASGAFYTYHTQRNLENIIIPEHITRIENDAFSGCTHLRSITYHGFTFSPDISGKIKIDRILSMIDQKNFSVRISLSVKYRVLWEMFFSKPDDPDVWEYIKAHFNNMLPVLIDLERMDIMQKVLDSGLIKKQNIDKFISYAIDHQKLEMQILLTDYKNTHIGYDDTETIIKKKFAL